MKHLFVRLAILIILILALVIFILAQSQDVDPEPILETNSDLIPSYTNASDDLIMVASPTPGDTISSPLTIAGTARGTWYFEATAPVTLVNWDGLIIAEGYVTATEDWMTEEFVSFEGTLEFPSEPEGDPETTPALFLYPRGALILHASNPSGLPENNRAVEIPVRFD